jgi:hypothetical protein
MILMLKPVIENVLKYKNKMADCINGHLNSTIVTVIVVVVAVVGKYAISFMQGIYTYIPETNNVPKEYSVAAILSLLFMAPLF